MTAKRLSTIRVEKPWGRMRLWPGFGDPAPDDAPIGEIWFDAPDDTPPALMVKYLFTSERLSIQVHPNDAEAQARGFPCGKDEAWVILSAEPDSTIALGTVRPVDANELRAAALDGSIEQLMHWQPVKAGDIIYSAANTVHAIGAGITVVEVQQNLDLTYRLYDYGRPRELHLDDGVTVSRAEPFVEAPRDRWKFDMIRRPVEGTVTVSAAGNAPIWCVPLAGDGVIDGAAFKAGECWLADAPVMLAASADMLFASTAKLAIA
jgi:mannose-6-phosphate isomerase